jgi:hypothetical protein
MVPLSVASELVRLSVPLKVPLVGEPPGVRVTVHDAAVIP